MRNTKYALSYKKHNPLKNEKGILTLDFLFAFVMVLGFSALFFALSITLTVAEITQYITFAAARDMYAGSFDVNTQLETGAAKYNELVNHKVFKPLYNNGWFQITNPPVIGQVSNTITNYQSKGKEPNKFFGVATQFTAKMLDFNIPFYGPTAPDSDGTGSGFKSIIGSYLGREINTFECTSFTGDRWSFIRQLPVSGASPYTTSTTETGGGYKIYTDDGC